MATGQAVPKGVELMERLKRLLAYSSRDAAVIARIREEALILWPTDPGQASEILGIVASLNYDESATREFFDQAHKLRSNDAGVEGNYALSLFRFGRFRAAQERIEQAIGLAPADLTFLDNAIRITAISGGFEKAAALDREWSKLSPNQPHQWHAAILYGVEYLADKHLNDQDIEQLVDFAADILREARAELRGASVFKQADEETEWLSIHLMRAGPVKQIVDLNVRLAKRLAAALERPKASHYVTVMYTPFRPK